MRDTVERYIQAYNSKDITAMINTVHDELVFENFANGDLNSRTSGVNDFKSMAEQSIGLFRSRNQRIIDFLQEQSEKVIVKIEFTGVLAGDSKNGIQEGLQLNLEGRSEFHFKDGLISYLGVHTIFAE